jgi:glycine/sarcosine N-methyltransferase
MKEHDTYKNIAEYYDYMLKKNPQREAFFARVFQDNGVKTVLDCACGTGNDLVMFNSLGVKVTGSDLSDSMLEIARRKIKENNLTITLVKADFHKLSEHFDQKFDAVVCLSNAVNEIDIDIDKALRSFKSVLAKKGIIVFDQGQTDYTMKNPPRYFPEVNDRDFTRLFIMDYQDNLMKVEIFDFLHKEKENDFRHSEFLIKIRLYDDWVKILEKAKLTAKYYGDWDFQEYSKSDSKRLIIVAKRL